MSVRRSIDSTALKARFREAATARGIDPVEGATSFQVVHHVTARQRRVVSESGWWNDPDLWDREDDPIRHSFIEEAALLQLFYATYLNHVAAVGKAAQTAPDADIPPLREQLAARGERLQFVEAEDGTTISKVALAV